jgi:hypothetical protein
MIFLKTDFVGVLFIILYVLFIIALLAAPIVLAFFLYRWLKKKGNIYKTIGLVVLIATSGLMSFAAFKVITDDSGLEPEYETVEIEQNVGGVLICSSSYYIDYHSWDYYIDYMYRFPNDSISEIGAGRIHGENWERDEQIIRVGDWYVLKVSHDRDADVLFIGDEQTKKWREYVISPQFIEGHELWKKERISTQLNNWNTVAKIEKVSPDGTVVVKYKFRKGNARTNFQNGKRYITFKINSETGVPVMLQVSKK